MIRILASLALAATACTAHGPWTHAEWDPQPWADAAIRVTGDRKGWLAAGGVVVSLPDLDAECPHREGWHAAGCAAPGRVWILTGPPERTALAHEFCHLGLAHGGGYAGPLIEATEPQADACALMVRQEAIP